MATKKYNYLKVIQQNYGQGWEDVSEYDATSTGNAIEISDKLSPKGRKETLLSHDLREYKLMGYPTRVIFRKEIKKQTSMNAPRTKKKTIRKHRGINQRTGKLKKGFKYGANGRIVEVQTPAEKKRQTGSTNVAADKKKRALPPGKRKSASGRTYYERRANRSDKGRLLGSIELTRVNNDVNGNPRYAVHFLSLINENDKGSISKQYEIALKKAKTIGGRKYHNKNFGGGIVFQSYNTTKLIEDILKAREIDYSKKGLRGTVCVRRNGDGSSTTYSPMHGTDCYKGDKLVKATITTASLNGARKKKPTAKQIAARKKFVENVRAGKYKK